MNSNNNSNSNIKSLITTAQIKEITVIQSNVNSDAIEPYLSIAEDLWLRPMLGEALYADIRRMYEEGGGEEEGLTDQYKVLYKYIVPVLSYYAMYEYLPFSYIKITNRGLEKGKEGTVNAELNELYMLRDVVLNHAKAYSNKMVDYLNVNKEAYLLWSVNGDGTDNGKCSPSGEDGGKTSKKSLGGLYFG